MFKPVTSTKLLYASLSAVSITVAGMHPAYAGDPAKDLDVHYKGVREPSRKEVIELHQRKVKHVKPNALAIERKNKELKEHGKREIDFKFAERPENEFEIDDGTTPDSLRRAAGFAAFDAATAGVTAIPASLDNSVLAAAPPIGNQGSENSCVAFATTYYQASHEICLARGCDNKTSNTNILSPKWTYNMINGGVDDGSWFADAFALLEKNGAATLSQLPYFAGDYRSWDTNAADWRSALTYRMNPSQYMSGVSSAAGLANLKQALANGHVLTFSTYVSSWQFTQVKADPAVPSPYAGQYVMSYMNGTSGAHAMTIVGYDDTVWTDLNGNGVVDPGEKGALKVANSWGTGWGNSGYIWVAYDALLATTAVAGGPVSSTRQGALWSDIAYTILAKSSYTPRLIAEFTVNHLTRNQMTLQGGASATTSSTPTAYAGTGAFISQGGPYAFDGTTTAVDASFVLDLSDVVPSTPASMNYYLGLSDSVTGNPLTLKSAKLVNLGLNQEVLASTTLPLSADGASKYVAIPYSYSDGNTPPVAQISATAQSLNGGLNVTFDGSTSYDPNGSVVSYAWNFGDGSMIQTNSTLSHFYANAGSYNVQLTVTDNQGSTGTASYLVKVADIAPPTAPANLTAALVTTGKSKKNPTIDLGWSAASDNVGVAAYDIYRNNAFLASTTARTYSDTGTKVGGGAYTYYVVARDAASNKSSPSNTVSITR